MKLRITLFIVFQIVAWMTYFNWGTPGYDRGSVGTMEKALQVEEMSVGQFTSSTAQTDLYKIILRNDGFFTRINNDQSAEYGLWSIDHQVPSLVLRMPEGDQKFRILDASNETLLLQSLNSVEPIQVANAEPKEQTLYSSLAN